MPRLRDGAAQPDRRPAAAGELRRSGRDPRWLRLLARGLAWTGCQPLRPQWLVLEATNQCGRRCPVCGAAQARRQVERGFMEWDLFLRLADEAARLRPRRVCLHAHGEPLLHRRIAEMVAELRARGLFTQIVTNGDPLTVELSRQLLAAGLSELVVSHHGVSAANERVCRGESAPDVDEPARIRAAIAPWAGAGRSVVLRTIVVPWLVPEGALGLARYLEGWTSAPGLERVELVTYQPWPRHVREDLLPALYPRRKPCVALRDGLNVLWNGVVTPCSFDATGELALGRSPQLALGEAWRGPALRQLRRANRWGGRWQPVACRSCLVTRSPAPICAVLAREAPAGEGERAAWVEATARKSWGRLTVAGTARATDEASRGRTR